MSKILILGATSPIARRLAMRFATDGAHLFLAARDAVEVERVASDVSLRSGVLAMSGTFDASDFAAHDGFIRHVASMPAALHAPLSSSGPPADHHPPHP